MINYEDNNLLLEDLKSSKKVKRILIWEFIESLEWIERGFGTFSIIAGLCYLPFFNHLFRYETFSDFYFFESILWSNLFIILFFYPKKRRVFRLILAFFTFLIWLLFHKYLLLQNWYFDFWFLYFIIQISVYGFIITILPVSIYNYYKAKRTKQKILNIINNI
jgi:hypothetical protein